MEAVGTGIRGGEGPLRRMDRILVDASAEVQEFLDFHRGQAQCPITTSVDVRRNRCKAAVVDTNAFPAGFNNLAKRSHADATAGFAEFMRSNHPDARSVLLIGEDHTRNAWYYQNLKTIRDLILAAGVEVTVGTLNPELAPHTAMGTALGDRIDLHGVERDGDALVADGKQLDVVILNNDLSNGIPDILQGVSQPVVPDTCMGWHRRSKAEHFGIMNDIAKQLGDLVGFDPWLISAAFERVDDVDFKARQGLEETAAAIDLVLDRMRVKYDEYGVSAEPQVFVKADAGTYGMGITTATSGEEFLAINSKGREKMDKGKGRSKTRSVIVQEGVPTEIRQGDAGAAEPVLYMVCGRVVGGFYRVHDSKGPQDNLNSPGSRFEPFLTHDPGDAGPDEAVLDPVTSHVYQVLGELASIATAYECRFADRPEATVPAYP